MNNKPAESIITTSSAKPDRKRKLLEVDSDQSETTAESEKNESGNGMKKNHRAVEGIENSSGTEAKSKKKSKKHKKDKDRKKEKEEEDAEDESLYVACVTHQPVSPHGEEDQQKNTSPKQKNKQKEKRVTPTEKELNLTNEGPPVSGKPEPATEIHEKKSGVKTHSEPEATNAAEEPILLTSSPAVANANDSSIANKPQRKRRRKKGGRANRRNTNSSNTSNSAGPAVASTSANIAPAPLRLPKSHQPRSKKIVFSSDKDSDSARDDADAENRKDDDQCKPSESNSKDAGISSSFSGSFNESFPAISTPYSSLASQTMENENSGSNARGRGFAKTMTENENSNSDPWRWGFATGVGETEQNAVAGVSSGVGLGANDCAAPANSNNVVNEEVSQRHRHINDN